MKTDKNVKISFHQLFKKKWKKKNEENSTYFPLLEINDIIVYIRNLPQLQKFHNLVGGKFCFLELVDIVNGDSNVIFKGFFKSARNEFRPDLINKITGVERTNPKQLSEGEVEKTHFVIKIDKKRDEVYLLLELNYHGITCSSVIDYFTSFNKSYLKSINQPQSFTIVHAVIPGNDFLDGLQLLSRTKLAEVHFDKQLLGSKALNFSNRTVSLKQDLKLVASAAVGESIKEVAVDLFNAFNRKESGITKVRIFGIDENNNDVILDTSKIVKIEFVKVDLNPETGEVMTPQIISGLVKISEIL
jgi:hypothetical protein